MDLLQSANDFESGRLPQGSLPTRGQKIAAKARERWAKISPEERKRITSAGLNKANPSRKIWWNSLSSEEKQNRINMARKSPKAKAARSEENKRRWKDPEYRKKMSEMTKARWAAYTPERRSEISAPGLLLATPAARKARPTSIEVAVHKVLDALGIKYVTEEPFGRYSADIYIPAAKLVIECDGTYWHSSEDDKQGDARKDRYLRALGLRVIRIPQSDIDANAQEAVLLRLVS